MLGALPPRETAVEGCAQALKGAILRREFLPGARLPAERALALRLGVNRTTLRGALGRLEAAGLVAVRQGSGTVVRDWRREGGPDLIADVVRLAGAEGLAEIAPELLTVRRALAGALLPRALERAGERELKALGAAIDELERRALAGAEVAALAEADVAVVAALVDAGGSAVLGLCVNPVLGVLRGLPELAAALYAEPLRNVVAWRALHGILELREAEQVPMILAALEAGDAVTLARLGEGRAKGEAKAKAKGEAKGEARAKAKAAKVEANTDAQAEGKAQAKGGARAARRREGRR